MKLSMLTKRSLALRVWILIISSFILVGIGLATYKDYGISWDERVERLDGAVALRFIEQKTGHQIQGLHPMLEKQQYPDSLELSSYKDRYYPVGFNLPVEGLIRLLDINSEQSAYYFRHLMTLGICLLGVLAIYRLAQRRFSNWKMGFLAATMYVLSPRLYGEWFYNSKDMVLLSLFAIAMYFAISYLQKPNYRNAILFGITTAFALNIRLMAIILPMLVGGMLIVEIIRHQVTILRAILTFMSSGLVMAAIVIAAWPLLWESPIAQLLDALSFMAKYRFNQDILYFGQIISSLKLPWHYLPVWIGITTPILYLVLWIIGLAVIIKTALKLGWQFWENSEQMQDVFFLTLFLAPVLGFIVLRPVIYDGWRHFYFIYPAFLMVALRGFSATNSLLENHKTAKRLLTTFFALSLMGSGTWMIWAHPLQNVYFNLLIGSNWRSKFDVDYWGLSNRQALEYIALNDKREKIYIQDGAYNFLPLTLSIIDKSDAERIVFTENSDRADYLVTNYRLNLTDYAALPSNWALEKQIFAGNELVSSIYRAKKNIYASKVQVDEPIYFGKQAFGQYFLHSGDWALPEVWGVWAQKPKALIYLPFPQSSIPKVNELELSLRALVAPSHPLQKIAVRINDGTPLFFNLKSNENNIVKIPLPISVDLHEKENSRASLKVEIESFNAVKPSQLGMGDDRRLLSVGLISAMFTFNKR